MYEGITRIDNMNGILVKREDLSCWSSLQYPSGSKVRQYRQMILNCSHQDSKHPTPMLVGCSANSCQQIYVASAGKLFGHQSIIYVPERAKKTDATLYCERMGAEIVEIKPGYLSVIRKRARQRAVDLKEVIQWDRNLAILDTVAQCVNIPSTVKRIIVPTGSGLTAAGVLIGVIEKGIEVVAVATSPMVIASSIMNLARRFMPDKTKTLGTLTFVVPTVAYDRHRVETLPDETPLDPFYAAKAWHLAKAGDMFWPPGLRPIMSMPEDCREAFKGWKGPV